MQALSLDAPRQFRFVTIATPGQPGPGQVRLRVHRVGICGTDYGGYLGKMPFYSYPRIPGHELGVEVVAVGDGVTQLKVGDRASVEPYLNCGVCYGCQRGHSNCCPDNKTLGVMCDGGMTDEIILPAHKVHASDSLSYEQLALVETLGIGCHAVDRGRPTADESVLVIGAGPIGLSAIEFARLSGAKVIVMDMAAHRLEFVRQSLGVPLTIAVDPSEPQAALAQLVEMTDGRLADVVIDATGHHLSMAGALNYAATGGRIVYVGITQTDIPIPHPPALHRRELSILASRNALPKDFRRIIGLIESGEIDTRPWITHRAPLGEIIDRFPQWLDPTSAVIKAMVSVT